MYVNKQIENGRSTLIYLKKKLVLSINVVE